MNTLNADILLALPELAMAIGGMALLMVGVFAAQQKPGLVNILAVLLFAIVAALILRQPCAAPTAEPRGGGRGRSSASRACAARPATLASVFLRGPDA